MVDEPGTGGAGEKFRAETDESAGRDSVIQPHPAAAVGAHVVESAAPRAQELHDLSLVTLLDIDSELLEGLAELTVNLLENHPWAGDGELVAFAAHVLDENREMQLAPSGDQKAIRIARVLHAQGDVVNQLA